MTEWQEETQRFLRPFSLLWAFDDRAATERNDDVARPTHQKQLPLLPFWTCGVVGDGNCMPRALVLGDVAPSQQILPIWDALIGLERDPLWGTVRESNRDAEKEQLRLYRQRYVVC